MRITNQMMADANAKYLMDSIERVNKAQNQVNTGKAFENASDDPLAASFSLSLNSSLRTLKTFKDTATSVDEWMGANDYAFQQMNDISMQANNLILSGLNDTLDASTRTGMSAEIGAMLDQALNTANLKQGEQYIFSGYQTDKPAFEFTDTDPATGLPNPPIIAYKGDNGMMQRTINIKQTVQQNIDGGAAFQGFLDSLLQARQALKANNTTDLRTSLANLQTATAAMGVFQTANGGRWRQVLSTSDFLDKSTQETKSLLSQKEDISLAQGITELQKQQTNYQVVMEVTSRAISAMTLFDYLK